MAASGQFLVSAVRQDSPTSKRSARYELQFNKRVLGQTT